MQNSQENLLEIRVPVKGETCLFRDLGKNFLCLGPGVRNRDQNLCPGLAVDHGQPLARGPVLIVPLHQKATRGIGHYPGLDASCDVRFKTRDCDGYWVFEKEK